VLRNCDWQRWQWASRRQQRTRAIGFRMSISSCSKPGWRAQVSQWRLSRPVQGPAALLASREIVAFSVTSSGHPLRRRLAGLCSQLHPSASSTPSSTSPCYPVSSPPCLDCASNCASPVALPACPVGGPLGEFCRFPFHGRLTASRSSLCSSRQSPT
jgi:hypothetical protein